MQHTILCLFMWYTFVFKFVGNQSIFSFLTGTGKYFYTNIFVFISWAWCDCWNYCKNRITASWRWIFAIYLQRKRESETESKIIIWQDIYKYNITLTESINSTMWFSLFYILFTSLSVCYMSSTSEMYYRWKEVSEKNSLFLTIN